MGMKANQSADMAPRLLFTSEGQESTMKGAKLTVRWMMLRQVNFNRGAFTKMQMISWSAEKLVQILYTFYVHVNVRINLQ